jgi:large subunit ribosomal protein L4
VELSTVSVDGKSSGKLSVSAEVFSAKPNQEVVHSALLWYMNARRRGTHSAKTRSEVAGSGKKPWKQKGTGRARSGSAQSPLWRGGGVHFPPKPSDHAASMPKKARKLALKVVLSDKAKGGRIKVVEGLNVSAPKTKEMAGILKAIGVGGKVLLVTDSSDRNVLLSARNIDGIKLAKSNELNIHDLLSSEWVVLDKTSVKKLEEALVK